MAELDQLLVEEALFAALDFYDADRADQADTAAGGGGLESDMRRRHRELMQKARGG